MVFLTKNGKVSTKIYFEFKNASKDCAKARKEKMRLGKKGKMRFQVGFEPQRNAAVPSNDTKREECRLKKRKLCKGELKLMMIQINETPK